jgi:Tfp pilus assembly protein PilX
MISIRMPGMSTRPSHSDESGVALVMVVGSMLVLAMLAMTALAYTMSSQKFARYDQDFSASVSAAQSGVEDFVSRLNRDDTYGQQADCTNTAMRGPGVTGGSACGWTSTTTPGWMPVTPGGTDPQAAWFHYVVNASAAVSQGTIMLTVTGRVHGVYRTLEVAVGKGGSTDYVYYTDFESADPSNVQAYPSTPSAVCGGNGYSNAKYWYNGRSSANPSCQEITFISGDTLDGTVFSNDAILSSGGSFLKGVLTANPSCSNATTDPSTWNACLRSGSTANFNGIQPLKADPKYLQDTSAAFATNPGCHYYGSTRIIFNADGTMKVWNKTVNNGGALPTAIAPPGGSAPSCGSSLAALDAGVTLPVPNEMVIYVATASGVTQSQCFAGQIGGPSGRTLPLGTYSSTNVAAPTSANQSYTEDTNMTESTKYCGQGNLYVEGTLKGRTTVSAAQSVIATGDLVLAGGMNGSDMLGLVATNSVEVFHPRIGTVTSTLVNGGCHSNCAYKWGSVQNEQEEPTGTWPTRYTDPTTNSVNPTSGIQIAGSIQTLQHSFYVQKYSVGGAAGQLLVNGSIAQRWRGIVGSGSNGYKKDYRYDTRLKYSAPPYFPKWTDSQWSLRYSGEVNTSSSVRTSSP